MNYQAEVDHLGKQIQFLEEAINVLSPTHIGYNELTSVIGPILSLNIDTAKSIKLLAENNHLRDLIILSRPFVEAVINVGFICAKGYDAIIKSKEYAYQKGYRDLFRGLKINDFEIKSGLIDHKESIDEYVPEKLKAAISAYTSVKGKEKSSWTEETTKEKLELLSAKYGIGVTGFLSFAFYNIYRDVSEIIHGSYYGMRIFTGMQNKDITAFSSSADAAQYFTDHQFKLATLILQQVSITIYSMIEILDIEFTDIPEVHIIRKQSQEELSIYANKAATGDK